MIKFLKFKHHFMNKISNKKDYLIKFRKKIKS